MRILLVVYDNDMFLNMFPIGLAYISGTLIKEGHDVEIYNQDVHHYPEKHLTDYLDQNRFDVIGLGFIAGYYQYRKIQKISRAINNSRNRPFYIIGGHGPSPEPEFFLKKTGADAAVIGEGETTILELIEALKGNLPLSAVKGIAYRERDNIAMNERRALIEDIDSIPLPAYHLFPIEFYRLLRLIPNTERTDFVMPIISGRGCPFKCNFCYRLDEGYRPRSDDSIIDEIRFLKSRYNINYISFQDDLLMTSESRTVNFCESLLKADVNIKWACNGRLNYAKSEVLRMMKKAGCHFVNYGIESMDDRVLKNMNKLLTTDQIIKGVEATLEAGLSPGLNVIFGNIGDTRETLQKGLDFLLKYSTIAQFRTIRPVTPYPGSPLYYYAIDKGLLRDCEDFYENKHINSDLVAVNFTNLSDDEFHECLLETNTRIAEDYYEKQLASVISQSRRLYLEKNIAFRGYRQT